MGTITEINRILHKVGRYDVAVSMPTQTAWWLSMWCSEPLSNTVTFTVFIPDLCCLAFQHKLWNVIKWSSTHNFRKANLMKIWAQLMWQCKKYFKGHSLDCTVKVLLLKLIECNMIPSLWAKKLGCIFCFPSASPSKQPWACTKCLLLLRCKLEKKTEMRGQFLTFMQNMFETGQAGLALPLKEKEYWYLPMFGINQPQKPGQIQVVWVPEDHRDYLWFLWYEDNNLEKPVTE